MSGLFGEARASTIARTETAIAYNKGAAASYKAEGVSTVLVLDGEGCLPEGHDDGAPAPDGERGVQDDAQADGQIWTPDEYAELPTGHPNCVRSAAPITEQNEIEQEDDSE
jgi:hypothetical protein